tara:strand:+ start:17 stop:157 length:141 start_codon:yes stop_codon:yes gene_type:complete
MPILNRLLAPHHGLDNPAASELFVKVSAAEIDIEQIDDETREKRDD